jgi:hypothetical protein
MLRGELPSRFDYLFEPLEADEPAGNGGDAPPEILLRPEEDNRWSNRMVLAGVVLATLAAAAAMAIVLLQPGRPADQIVTPSDATSPATARRHRCLHPCRRQPQHPFPSYRRRSARPRLGPLNRHRPCSGNSRRSSRRRRQLPANHPPRCRRRRRHARPSVSAPKHVRRFRIRRRLETTISAAAAADCSAACFS